MSAPYLLKWRILCMNIVFYDTGINAEWKDGVYEVV